MSSNIKGSRKGEKFQKFLSNQGLGTKKIEQSQVQSSSKKQQKYSQIIPGQRPQLNSRTNPHSSIDSQKDVKQKGKGMKSKSSINSNKQTSPIKILENCLSDYNQDQKSPQLGKSSNNPSLIWQDSMIIRTNDNLSLEQQESSVNSSMYIVTKPMELQKQGQDDYISKTPFYKRDGSFNYINNQNQSSQGSCPNILQRIQSKKSQFNQEFNSSSINHTQCLGSQQFKKAILNEIKAQVREQLKVIKDDLKELRELPKLVRQMVSLQKDYSSKESKNSALTEAIYTSLNKLQLLKNIDSNHQQTKNSSKQQQQLINQKCENLQRQNQKLIQKNFESYKNIRDLQQQLQQKVGHINQIEKQLSNSHSELDETLSQKYLALKQKVQFYQQQAALKKLQISTYIRPMFVSNILFKHSGQGFLRLKIQQFQKKTIQSSELLFQKDRFNSNIGQYIQQYPYPFVLLIETKKQVVFGLYGEGIESQFTRKLKEKVPFTKFNAFLFNLSKQLTFINDKETTVTSVLFSDSLLRIGNSQLVIKNNSLDSLKVYSGRIIGECYYNLSNREYLTEEDQVQISIKNLELHKLSFL